MTIPIAPMVGLAAGMIGPIEQAIDGRYYDAFRDVCINYTGYNPQAKGWAWGNLKVGLYPLIAGLLVHRGASMLGINRILAASKVPLLRV